MAGSRGAMGTAAAAAGPISARQFTACTPAADLGGSRRPESTATRSAPAARLSARARRRRCSTSQPPGRVDVQHAPQWGRNRRRRTQARRRDPRPRVWSIWRDSGGAPPPDREGGLGSALIRQQRLGRSDAPQPVAAIQVLPDERRQRRRPEPEAAECGNHYGAARRRRPARR